MLPKIHSAQDLNLVSRQVYSHLQSTSPTVPNQRAKPLHFVASIESARALYHIGEIAGWQSEFGPLLGGRLVALLVRFSGACAVGMSVLIAHISSLQRIVRAYSKPVDVAHGSREQIVRTPRSSERHNEQSFSTRAQKWPSPQKHLVLMPSIWCASHSVHLTRL